MKKHLKFYGQLIAMSAAFTLLMLGIAFIFHLSRSPIESASYFVLYLVYMLMIAGIRRQGPFARKRISEHTIHEDMEFLQMYLERKEYDNALRLARAVNRELKASHYVIYLKNET